MAPAPMPPINPPEPRPQDECRECGAILEADGSCDSCPAPPPEPGPDPEWLDWARGKLGDDELHESV
jgi:hypothetical protein